MQRFADMASPRCVVAVFANCVGGCDHELKSGWNITGHLCLINGLRTLRVDYPHAFRF